MNSLHFMSSAKGADARRQKAEEPAKTLGGALATAAVLREFLSSELAAAVARGVRQFVTIGSRLALREAFESPPAPDLAVFAVDENQPSDSPVTFVPTQFASEPLSIALEKSNFDKFKATLFVWFGGAGYRTADAAIASLAFIASLPAGSGVVFDYAVERTSLGTLAHTALDSLATRICGAGGAITYLIQPPAVAALLRGAGFKKIVDLASEELPLPGAHFVSAAV